MSENGIYKLPSGDGKQIIPLDLFSIKKAETRLREVATVTPGNAQELLSTYNISWLALDKIVKQLTHEKTKAMNSYKQARADAKLNCTDEALKKLGHSKGSADLREALVEKDETVIHSKERLDQIEAVLSVMEGKREGFRNAFSAVKKLMDSNWLPARHYGNSNRPGVFQAPGVETQDPEYILPEEYNGK